MATKKRKKAAKKSHKKGHKKARKAPKKAAKKRARKPSKNTPIGREYLAAKKLYKSLGEELRASRG
jgi:hypothetical protein